MMLIRVNLSEISKDLATNFYMKRKKSDKYPRMIFMEDLRKADNL